MEAIARRALMTKYAVTDHVTGAFDRMRRDDRGQGAVEYVGIIIAVVIVLVGVMAVLKEISPEVDKAIKGAIEKVTKFGEGGPK
ncbi:MAG: hypothetical protein FWH11_07940 [Micrococcales bacterium]|nr:hypothetical protein [Micrococcales bacterium]